MSITWYVKAKPHDDEIILTAPTVKGMIELIEALFMTPEQETKEETG